MAKTQQNDRRSRRTRRYLREALKELILEKGYEEVTVQDIATRADVGRSTFYAHFENKDKLHLSAFDHVFAAVFQDPPQNEITDFGVFRFNSLALFRHAAQSCRIYRALKDREAGRTFLAHISRRMEKEFLESLKSSLPADLKNSFRAEAAAHFFVGSLLTMLTFWLDRGMPLAPEEMNEAFKKLVAPGLENFAGYPNS